MLRNAGTILQSQAIIPSAVLRQFSIGHSMVLQRQMNALQAGMLVNPEEMVSWQRRTD